MAGGGAISTAPMLSILVRFEGCRAVVASSTRFLFPAAFVEGDGAEAPGTMGGGNLCGMWVLAATGALEPSCRERE